MYEKILFPLDGSELAEVALPYAEELAGRLGSEVTLVYVREPDGDQSPHMYQCYMRDMVETTKHGAEKNLGKLVAKEIKVDSVILAGDPAEQIVEYADKKHFNLIVIFIPFDT